jgi:hypothetical protein
MAVWRAVFWIVIIPLAAFRRVARRRAVEPSESAWRAAPTSQPHDAGFFRSMRGSRR